jgi:ubiquinol-cytochrome c reductase iron-sulfur subunit
LTLQQRRKLHRLRLCTNRTLPRLIRLLLAEKPIACVYTIMSNDINLKRRRFLVILSSIFGGVAALFASIPFFSALRPTARSIRKAGPVDVDLRTILPGNMITVEWQGKPVWVLRRTHEMINLLEKPNPQLRDPNSRVDQQPPYAQNLWRSRHPDILVLVGICTHLGCIPQYQSKKDFYCPCHGSVFDLAGRVFKNVPAPINLEVPPYYYLDENHVRIGVSQ